MPKGSPAVLATRFDAAAIKKGRRGVKATLPTVHRTESDGRRLIWPGKRNNAGFVDALLGDPKALDMISSTCKDQADPAACMSAAPDFLHDKHSAAIRRMQKDPRRRAAAMMRKLSRLDRKEAELL